MCTASAKPVSRLDFVSDGRHFNFLKATQLASPARAPREGEYTYDCYANRVNHSSASHSNPSHFCIPLSHPVLHDTFPKVHLERCIERLHQAYKQALIMLFFAGEETEPEQVPRARKRVKDHSQLLSPRSLTPKSVFFLPHLTASPFIKHTSRIGMPKHARR